VYFLAWDGTSWSEPQPQSSLYSFTDPVTNGTVNFRCRQYALQKGNRLNAVGCDTVGDGDIWATARDVGDFSSWFPPPTTWSKPYLIGTSNLEINSPEIVMNSEGKPYAFWIQEEQTSTGSFQRAIYAASSIPDGWTKPGRVLKSPDNYVQRMAIASDADGRVSLVWEGGRSGGIYFSTADLENATSPTEWFDPVSLPLPQGVGRSPSIAVSQAGIYYVAFAVPLNEGRGIYMVSSSDGGKTWSEPVMAFDAGAAGWQMVDTPQLTLTDDNTLHLLFTQNEIIGEEGVVGLYYANSKDQGQTWTQPIEVIAQPIWASQLEGLSNQVVHRLWMGLVERKGSDLYHEFSNDNGETWSPSVNLTKFGEIPGPFCLVSMDETTHLLQIVNETSGKLVLSNLRWENERWLTEEGLEITDTIEEVNSISADAGPDGELGVVFIAQQIDQSGALVAFELLYAGQSAPTTGETTPSTVETTLPTATLSADELTPAPQTQETIPTDTPPSETVVTATPESQQTVEATPILTTTVVPISTLNSPENPGGSPNMVSVLVLAAIVAGLVFAAGIGITLFRSRM
jgi:hypothetical protein